MVGFLRYQSHLTFSKIVSGTLLSGNFRTIFVLAAKIYGTCDTRTIATRGIYLQKLKTNSSKLNILKLKLH